MEIAQPLPQTQRRAAGRFWELDTVRGIVVILMVYFHLMWNLYYWQVTTISVFTPEWQLFARSIGSTFTFLLGLSLAIRYAKVAGEFQPYLRRGLLIFGCGLLVTLATFFVVPEEYVIFGILHMQGVALILAYLCVRLPAWLNVLLGVLVLTIGNWMMNVFVPYPWLIPFGIQQAGRMMADYYPLFPWLAPALFGLAAGRLFYPAGRRSFALPELGENLLVRGLRFLGRHSLVIYLVHQPIIIGIMLAFGLARL